MDSLSEVLWEYFAIVSCEGSFLVCPPKSCLPSPVRLLGPGSLSDLILFWISFQRTIRTECIFFFLFYMSILRSWSSKTSVFSLNNFSLLPGILASPPLILFILPLFPFWIKLKHSFIFQIIKVHFINSHLIWTNMRIFTVFDIFIYPLIVKYLWEVLPQWRGKILNSKTIWLQGFWKRDGYVSLCFVILEMLILFLHCVQILETRFNISVFNRKFHKWSD